MDDGWRVGGLAKGGAEGERANARSVTPHCAHLPTRPTPKFELGSQPHRFSSTRLPSSSPILDSSSPTRPSTLFTVNVRGEMSALSPRTSACTTSICDSPRSLSRSYSRREQSVEEYPLKRVACLPACLPVVFLRESISMSSATCLSRFLSLDNRHRVLVAVLVRHAAKRLDFARIYPTHRCLAESVPRRDPIDPSGLSSRYYFAGYR